jgi:purine nucleoside permease
MEHDVQKTLEQLLDNHAMLMGGVQLVVAASAKTDARIDATNQRLDTLVLGVAGIASNHGATIQNVRWACALVVLLLAWQIAERFVPAASPPAIACMPAQAIAVAP